MYYGMLMYNFHPNFIMIYHEANNSTKHFYNNANFKGSEKHTSRNSKNKEMN